MSLACVSAILISALSRHRVRDAREVRARRDLLADFHRHELQHPVEAGAHLQLVALLLRELEQRARLIDESTAARRVCARIESALLASWSFAIWLRTPSDSASTCDCSSTSFETS